MYPISSNWALDDSYCVAGNGNSGNVTVSFHVSTDIFIYILPLCVVRSLNLPKLQKYAVAVTFALGFICIVFAVAVILVYNLGTPAAEANICAIFEQAWSVTVVCCPVFKAFLTRDLRRGLRRVGRWKRDDVEEKRFSNATSGTYTTTAGTGTERSVLVPNSSPDAPSLQKPVAAVQQHTTRIEGGE